MSRARNIKPGFFKNDILAECHPLARLLFAGLWCEADRAGRLEDRPARIKVGCLPYDDCDVDALLNELVSHGFIVRYVVSNNKYIQILAFEKHQNPHKRESASSIPAPDKHSASTVQVPSEHGTGPADSPSLIPDSPSLIPPEEPKGSLSAAPCPQTQIIALYHELLPELPPAREWPEANASQLRARWRSSPERQSLDWWRKFFGYVRESDFLMGRKTDFQASLMWLVKAANFAKVVNGNYENRGNT